MKFVQRLETSIQELETNPKPLKNQEKHQYIKKTSKH